MNDWEHIKEKVGSKKDQLQEKMEGGVKGGLKQMKGKIREDIADTREEFDDNDDVI